MNKIFNNINLGRILLLLLVISGIILTSVTFSKYVLDLGEVGGFSLDVEPTATIPTAAEFRSCISSANTAAKQGTLRMVVFGRWDSVAGYTDNENNVTILPSEWNTGNNVDAFGAVKVFIRENITLNGSTAYILSAEDIIAPLNSADLFSAANDATFRYVQYIKFDNFHLPESDNFDATNMFRSCTALKDLDVSFWSSYGKRIILKGTFHNCSKLTQLNLSGIDFSICNNSFSSETFSKLTCLEFLDISHTTWAGGLMEWMYTATNTKVIDVTGIHTENVTQIDDLFNGWRNLAEIRGFSDFDTTNLKQIEQTFVSCSSLPDAYFVQFAENLSKGNNLTSCYDAFSGCTLMTASTAQNILNAISGNKLTKIYGMFRNCAGIVGDIDMSGIDLGLVTDVKELFKGCTQLTSVDLSGLNVAKITNMSSMFEDCTRLRTIYVDGTWNTAKVSSSTRMFTNCTNLVGGNGTVYDSSKTNKEYARIDNPPDSPGYFTLAGAAAYAISESIGVAVDDSEVQNALVTVDGDFIGETSYTKDGVLRLDIEIDDGYALPDTFTVDIDGTEYPVNTVGDENLIGIRFDKELGSLFISDDLLSQGSLVKIQLVCVEDVPVENPDVPTEGEQPTSDTKEPPVESEQTPTDGEDPPADDEQNHNDSGEPTADDEQVPADSEELPADDEQAPADSEELPVDDEQVPTENEQTVEEVSKPEANTSDVEENNDGLPTEDTIPTGDDVPTDNGITE